MKKRIKIIGIILSLMIIISSSMVVFADPIKTTAISDINKIWAYSGNNSYNEDGFGDSSAPANYIYGNTIIFKRYLGEEDSGKTDSEYRSDNSGNIYDKNRSVSANPNATDNYHALALANANNDNPSICNIISGICSWPIIVVNWAAHLANFDINQLISMFITNSEFGDTLKRIFLIDDTGEFSPFLAIFLTLWAFSLIMFIIKYIRGQSNIILILKEVGFFILSIFLFAVCNGNVVTKASSTAQDLILNLTNAFTEDLTNTDEFWRGTGYSDLSQQNIANEVGLVAKTVIDYQLCTLFNVDDITELDMGSYPVGNGSVTLNNVGYLYWAGNSILDYKSPISGGKANVSSKPNTNRYFYFVADLAQEEYGTELGNKIYNGITNPDAGKLAGNAIVLVIYGTAFGLSYLMIGLAICILNLFMICFGIICFVLPGLILYPKSRPMAQDILKAGIMSVVFQAILLTVKSILFVVFTACNGGIMECLIGSAILIVAMWKMPSLVKWFLKTLLSRVRFKTSVFNQINNMAYAKAAGGQYRNSWEVLRDTSIGVAGVAKETAHIATAPVRGAVNATRGASRLVNSAMDTSANRRVERELNSYISQQQRMFSSSYDGEEEIQTPSSQQPTELQSEDIMEDENTIMTPGNANTQMFEDVMGVEESEDEVLQTSGNASSEQIDDVMGVDEDVIKPERTSIYSENRDLMEDDIIRSKGTPSQSQVDDVMLEQEIQKPNPIGSRREVKIDDVMGTQTSNSAGKRWVEINDLMIDDSELNSSKFDDLMGDSSEQRKSLNSESETNPDDERWI